MPLKVGRWSGVHTLKVVPLDDFNVLVRIDFMRKFKVAPVPHLDSIIFMGEKDPGFMMGIHPFDEKDKKNNETLHCCRLLDSRKA